MQWWCFAQGTVWDWTWRPYPGVWIFIALLAAAYGAVIRASGPAEPGSGRGWKIASGAGGILALWAALDWPIGPLGAGYLASVHMVQYLLIGIAAPALLLLGIPEEAYARLERSRGAHAVVRSVTRPAVALIVFLLVTIVTHVPGVVDTFMASQLGSFVIDMAWLLAGVIFWWPIVAPVPARPKFLPPLQILYLFPASLAHTAISAYLVFSRYPVYATYELAPPTGWISALGDQQIAGGLMWVTATPIVWSVIGVGFSRWMKLENPIRTTPAEATAGMGEFKA